MSKGERRAVTDLDVDAALRTILEGTATETGATFFAALVRNLAEALQTHGAWVTEYLEPQRRLRALAFWMGGEWVEDYEIDIDGTPCQEVIDTAQLVHLPDNIVSLYPDDPELEEVGAVSYMGVPLLDVDGSILGHLAVLDTRPLPPEPQVHTIFKIFAARAAAELQRLRAETQVREREEKLRLVMNNAMDAIIEFDAYFRVTMFNTAAEKLFGVVASAVQGQNFRRLLAEPSQGRLIELLAELDARPADAQYLWIAGGLQAQTLTGKLFNAEATLSRYRMRQGTYHVLLLRNVEERLEAERRIRYLTQETAYLKEELRQLHNFDEIIGHSPAILQVLRDLSQVAVTDASVLILGETGTGKELIARAIHSESPRRGKALIKVNCAAVPAALIESEFFGHEKGAFTGATARREGRFALADGGSIFLDEVGELPVDLQAKLLRVLQEGEFEPVGSSQTRRVDVRVIAATNRDLLAQVQEGSFREDLYYRLNVFPLTVPPLRQRTEDIPLLAATFVQRLAQRMGRAPISLTDACVLRLCSYPWPGNVRELENVIERAMIIGRDGALDLDRALPESSAASGTTGAMAPPAPEDPGPVRTAAELHALEQENLRRAMEQTGWRIAGEGGAAQLLGMKPSTLASRLKALGLTRPNQPA